MLFKSKNQMIAIDIGTNKTKVVVGSCDAAKNGGGKNHKITVDEIFAFDTPLSEAQQPTTKTEEPVYTGSQVTEEYKPFFNELQLKTILEDELSKRKVKTDNATITIDNKPLITREMVMPKATGDKLRSMIKHEIEEYLPINVDQYLVDYRILEEVMEGDVEKYKLLVGALPRKIGKYYYDFLKSLHREPVALDTESNVISKGFERDLKINGQDVGVGGKTIAYIDIGYSNIEMNVIEKGILKFTRTLENGVKDIEENVVVEEDRGKIEEEHIGNWLQSLERMFLFFTSRETDRKIHEIYLYGGGAKLKGLSEKMEGALEIPTKVIENLDIIEFNKSCEDCPLSVYLNAILSLIRK
ncbi:pilus assembly protein PilM [Isachenkonia alkalipeptolytica]|uniref:Type IV pilus assembly protein PilM n=1 Tax=Isachenkonia alkalipeptolytica TaxID=2565777 RepID=A0AA43XJJ8_9CLOT|nr:pilus assembly protein PilM [Isachenkonia alkalipeptolytica]NBG87526.1 hypothetical protein [Isachenkonia alkalipeptolytica]